ncbi:glycoside hydrolase family 88/105 protein [Olivibacter sitiensis]|uniref:glycoside hydrolase family 88/105 protein n=1 Tax=Olivibacter sitiensis TaxID=376470 RepID=UPI0003F71EA6|nr:glycoside hydrolase family 88 protein [Olivibacter sitiensis]
MKGKANLGLFGIWILSLLMLCVRGVAQDKLRYSELLSERAMTLWPDSFALDGGKAKWSYDLGVILKGMEQVGLADGNSKWFFYMQSMMDHYVQENGEIKGYDPKAFNIDYVNNGKVLLTLYRVTGKKKYLLAVQQLRKQLREHPRTREGGFWHKEIYEHQMWLDGLYMAQPFYAEYAQLFGEDSIYDDVVKQFTLMEKHAVDEKSGLLYHGWDESRQQKWADPQTGRSPNFWGRSMGWFGMALVDALDYFPHDHPKRDTLIAVAARWASAIAAVQYKDGLWYQVLDMPEREGNYPESSASAMIVYALAKAQRLGYIDDRYDAAIKKGYRSIIRQFVYVDADDHYNLKGTVAVSGLGGEKNYRDGSFDYYISEPVIQNDPKGIGAFILCASEMELRQLPKYGNGKKVVLDYYYNREWRKGADGRNVRYHYTWEDRANSGYSLLGYLFNSYGAETDSLAQKPTKANLENAAVYIIVDPDTEKETEQPNFIEETEMETLVDWVSRGGVLVLLANDNGNCELDRFDELASRFGISFNKDNALMVKNDDFSQGTVYTSKGDVFKSWYPIYIKEISTLSVHKPAKVILKHLDAEVMAVSKYGKGAVFVLGDPWIYNEYLDGRKLPASLKNYQAAHDWVVWLLRHAR